MKGVVFDVKRFAVHDGEGIRTTLFLKGCALRCAWCQNPEGLDVGVRVWRRPGRCVGCGLCHVTCACRAVGAGPTYAIDPEKCVRCGECVRECPTGALAFDGWTVDAQEISEQLLRDRVFFGARGGVTLSGGEVLCQAEFARAVLAHVKRAGVDTAIETALYAPQSTLEALLPVVDHVIADIKCLDDAAHRRMTGQGNAQILANYAFLVRSGVDLLLRIPLIPGYTATDSNVRAIARHAHSLCPDARVELINYNPLCKGKYAARDARYPVAGSALTDAQLEAFYAVLREEGIGNLVRD